MTFNSEFFKPNEKIVCVDDTSAFGLLKGEVYEVDGKEDLPKDLVYLKEIKTDSRGYRPCYHIWRFERV